MLAVLQFAPLALTLLNWPQAKAKPRRQKEGCKIQEQATGGAEEVRKLLIAVNCLNHMLVVLQCAPLALTLLNWPQAKAKPQQQKEGCKSQAQAAGGGTAKVGQHVFFVSCSVIWP